MAYICMLLAILAFGLGVECQLRNRGFLAFGVDNGDTALTGDDPFSPAVNFEFKFYNNTISTIYVSMIFGIYVSF